MHDTYVRIKVYFIILQMEDNRLPDFTRKSIHELGVGTFGDIAKVS